MVDKKQSRKKESESQQSSSRSRSRSKSNKKKSYRDKNKKKRKSHSSSSRKRSYSISKSISQERNNEKKREKHKKSKNYDEEIYEKAKRVYEAESKKYKPQMEESNCLIMQNIDENITHEMIDQGLREVAINCQTSMPDEIKLVATLGTAYAVFPSKDSAKKILYKLEGILEISQIKLPIEFYPSSMGKNKPISQNLGKDVNLVQDWICDKCEYKNFARRVKCYKCENPRNQNCRIVYNSACIIRPNISSMHMQSQQTTSIDTAVGANTSLMVRGNVLFEISETTLLDIFMKIAPVKDIRMVKNKNTGQMRDFAFIEFYTIDEAETVLKVTQSPDFKINGQSVTVAFSKSRKRDEDYSLVPSSLSSTSNIITSGLASSNMNYYYDDHTGYYYQSGLSQQPYYNYNNSYDYYNKIYYGNNSNEQYRGNQDYNSSNPTNLYTNFTQIYQHPNIENNYYAQNAQINNQNMQSNPENNNENKGGLSILNKSTEVENLNSEKVSKTNESPLHQTKLCVKNENFTEKHSLDTNEEGKKNEKLNKNDKQPTSMNLNNSDEKTRRKQVEIELKKWEREQQKFFNPQNNSNSIQFEIKTSEISEEKNKKSDSSEKNGTVEKEKINIINFDKKGKTNFPNSMQKYNNSIMFVCLICKRKFEDEEKLRKHEKFSDFHREMQSKIRIEIL